MYSVGNAFHEAAQGSNRQIVVRTTFDDEVVVGGDYIQSVTINGSVNSGNDLTIGNTCSRQLTLNMFMPDDLTPAFIKSAKIFIEVGFLSVTNKLNALDTQLYVDQILGYLYQSEHTDDLTFSVQDGVLSVQSNESSLSFTLDGNEVIVTDSAQDVANATFWLPMGVYYVDKVQTRNDYMSVSITAFDGMALIEKITSDFSGLRTEPTAPEAIEVIAEAVGVECEIPAGLPNANVGITRTAYTKTSYRNALGLFASFLGGNAMFTREGKLTVKPYAQADYNISRDQQYMGGLTRTNDDALVIQSVTCSNADNLSDSRQSLSFNFGYWNSATNKFVKDFLPPYNYACFYSQLLPVVPGQKYTLTRTATDKQDSHIYFFGYTNNHHSIPKYQRLDDTNDFIQNYTPMSYNAKSITIQLDPTVTDIRYIRILAYNVNYTTTYPGGNPWYTMSNHYTFQKAETGDIQIGAGYGISFVNPLIYNTELLQPIYDYYNGFSYLPCSVKYRGNPALDSGDIITVEDKSGDPVNVFISSQVFKISGGMNSTIQSIGIPDAETSVSAAARYSSNTSSPTAKSDSQQAQINDLIARVTALEGQINSN